MLYREQNAQRALSPTSITIADYVINPYSGCDFGCVYCYARMNSTYQKKRKQCGEDFVEIKPNFISLLNKEIDEKKPSHVLIGSTTEVYQHIEKKRNITRQVLEILTAHNISYTILTKSHSISRDIDIIATNPRNEIYFTVNTLDDTVRQKIEPAASKVSDRIYAINFLHTNKIRVIVHVGPYLPFITDEQKIIETFTEISSMIEWESLNSKMAGQGTLMDILFRNYSDTYTAINEIYSSKETYHDYYIKLQARIRILMENKQKETRFFIYPFDSFYTNQIRY